MRAPYARTMQGGRWQVSARINGPSAFCARTRSEASPFHSWAFHVSPGRRATVASHQALRSSARFSPPPLAAVGHNRARVCVPRRRLFAVRIASGSTATRGIAAPAATSAPKAPFATTARAPRAAAVARSSADSRVSTRPSILPTAASAVTAAVKAKLARRGLADTSVRLERRFAARNASTRPPTLRTAAVADRLAPWRTRRKRA